MKYLVIMDNNKDRVLVPATKIDLGSQTGYAIFHYKDKITAVVPLSTSSIFMAEDPEAEEVASAPIDNGDSEEISLGEERSFG